MFKRMIKIFSIASLFVFTIILGSCGYEDTASYEYDDMPPVHNTHFYTITKYNETKHWNECSCGAKSNEENHIFGSWITTKEPTEEASGLKKRVCSVCGYEESSSIDKLEHKHVFSEDFVYDNTGHWHPAICDHITEKSGFEEHTFSNGICVKCKMKVFFLENLYFDINTMALPIELTTRKGYTCLGVFDVENDSEYFDGAGKRLSAISINAGQYLELRWKKNKYNLHYIIDEKEILMQSIEFENELPAFPIINPKEGFDFMGWFDEDGKVQYADKNGKYYDNYSILNATCEYNLDQNDIYFYGKYEKQTFTVSFYDFDGNIILTQIVGYGETATFDQEYPSKIVNNISYTFVDWDTDYQNVKSNLDVRPNYKISISNPSLVFGSIKANFNPMNVLPMNFGAHYQLELNPDEDITMKIYSLDGEELSNIIILNDDMSLDVVGLISSGEFNLFYKNEKLLSENIEFDINAGQLGAQIRKILIDKGVQVDVITEYELSLVEELYLSEHFKNNNEMNYVLGIKYLIGLKKLDISNNGLDEEYIRNILPTLKQLVYLDISNNNIHNLDVLNENKNLVYLDASSNSINTVTDSNSVESLRRLRKLEYLNLNNNSIADLSPIANLTSLKELNIGSNKINAKTIDSLISLWNLKNIDLSNNANLSDMSSFYSLKYITDLETVNLSGISLNGQFKQEETIGKINKFPTSTTLKKLILENCNLTDNDLLDLTKFINLKDLDISSNKKITQAGLSNYFIKLGAENNLEILNMSNLDNIVILPEFVNMSNLKKLTFNKLKSLADISNLQTSPLSNLEELSFNDCRNIVYSSSSSDSLNDPSKIFDNFTKLKSLSIINALEWIDRTLYDHLMKIVQSDPKNVETLNPNDLHLQLFAEENPISFDTILNYRKKIIFGIEELKQSENSTITAQDVKIIYQDNSKLYDLVISFLNDSEAQSKQTYKLIIPNGYQSLTIYGRISREYNIAIELEDRKDKLFVLNLHTFVTNGMAKTTTIKTNSECLLTINAYGEKVIIKGANGSSSGESGQNAIEAYDLEINNYTEDIFSIIGGNGVNGANGVTSEMNKNTECWQRKGKDGGAGGIAIVGHNIYFGANAFIISVTGGNGGNGGKGGEATGKFELYPSHNHMALFSGGDGGAGGNGGDAIRYSNYVTSQYQVKLTGGSAGAGGKKGNPNKSCWLYNNGPWFGTNGKNGIDGKTMNKVEE